MSLENTLDDVHIALTRRWWTQLFTAFTRCLLAVGFIPPSIPKILHKPFTVLPDTNPVGHYFNALMATGFYYEFIGWGQITAAVLLLIPRTSHIGALLFLPIIANISVLTLSVGFQGTWVITSLMCLAAIYLTAWEYDRLKPVVFWTRKERPRRFRYQFVAIPLFFAVGCIVMGLLFWMLRLGNLSNYLNVTALLAVIGLVFGVLVTVHYALMPVGHLAKGGTVK